VKGSDNQLNRIAHGSHHGSVGGLVTATDLRVVRAMTNVDPVQGALQAGAVTSIGSLPHRDADAAAAFVLRHHQVLPAAPQLPRRSPLEGMIAQAARGIPGVEVQPNGALDVDVSALDPAAPITPAFTGASHAGLLAFLALASGRTEPVKLQLTGPITLGMALTDAGAPPTLAFAIAAAAVRAEAGALVELVRRRLPDAPLLVFLDEPGLVRAAAGGLPIESEAATDVLSSALAAFENDAVTGVHCCGDADWRLVTAAGPTVLSLPVDLESVPRSAAVINGHLDRGGWIAWGVVPTDQPLGTDADRLWRRLGSVWSELAQAGCDAVQLRTQALVTPACGLAGHGVSQAALALRLAGRVATRVTDQAVAARLSAGA
jgi:methionine synthase II (cobalamin-independent)